ncbi:hypothetical protein [Nocardia sp. CNY236]|uniref:hypothetical protein n=1 Tax=Nocardia sp. CNY236 TaxID=1169152 RepID=UPI001E58963C|nr:hypothetical protein [Nocardia sp. CNY236]
MVIDSRASECVPPAATTRLAPTIRNGRPVLIVAGCLVLLQLTVRWWVADSGYFYWDDLILVGRAAEYGLWSVDLLLYDHDGHFMPLAFVTAWAVTEAAPLAWAGPMVVLLALQLGAAVAVLRLLVVVVGARWALVYPLAFYLFCPLTIPAFAWWSAALNALPLQFALAWVATDAVLLVRTGRRRYALSGIAVFVVALLFFEKSVVVPFVAFMVAALARYVDEHTQPIRVVARRGVALWAGSAIVLVCWSVVYLTVVGGPVPASELGEPHSVVARAASSGIVPALFGGPWVWERWLPSAPWADPPGWAVACAWLALAAMVVVSVRARVRVGSLWLAATLYLLITQVVVALVRAGPNTATELMQSLRYVADLTVVLAALGALAARARPRLHMADEHHGRAGARMAVAALVLLLVCSLWSTYSFVRAWQVGPTRAYLTNVQSALQNSDGAPLLDQEVPWNVLNPLAHPQNLTSRILAPVAAPGAFAATTPHLRMITNSGEIVDAAVWWNRAIVPGPEPDCGYRVGGSASVTLALDGPMIEREWTAQLNYVANRDGGIFLGLEYGPAVAVPVRSGMHTVFVRLVGSGTALRISAHTPGLELCIGVGPVGVASYDN